MRETRITVPELALVAGTRAALGAGIGLLLADRLSDEQRKAVGWTLFLVGALSTIPLRFELFRRQRHPAPQEGRDRPEQAAGETQSEADDRLLWGAFAEV
jgi:uncharacterized membrane protein YfcA